MTKKYGIWCSEPTGGWWFSVSSGGVPPVLFSTKLAATKRATRVQKANGGARSDISYTAMPYVPAEKRQPLKKKLIGVLTPTGLIPASEGVARKFLRMTLAERTKLVELFAGFSDADWRRFKRWIKKFQPRQASVTKRRKPLKK